MTRRRKIALVLPLRFSVRGFLETDVFERLREKANLLLISPFAENRALAQRYAGTGVRHATLPDFNFTGNHLRWHTLLQKVVKARWNLESHKVIEELFAYHGREEPTPPPKSTSWRLVRRAFIGTNVIPVSGIHLAFTDPKDQKPLSTPLTPSSFDPFLP